MNRLKFLILMVAMSLPFIQATAESNDSNKNNHLIYVGKTVLQHNKGVSKRPNAPSRLFIECAYGEGFIELAFPYGVTSISVSLSNGNEEWSGIVTAEYPVAYTPILKGEYSITCVTDAGYTFTGIINLE